MFFNKNLILYTINKVEYMNLNKKVAFKFVDLFLVLLVNTWFFALLRLSGI